MTPTANHALDVSITGDQSAVAEESACVSGSDDEPFHAGIRQAARSAFDYVLVAKNLNEPFANWPSLVHTTVDIVTTAQQQQRSVSVSVRVTDAQTIQDLNRDYRQRDKATNVLSFPGIEAADQDWTSTDTAIHTDLSADQLIESATAADTVLSLPELVLGDIVLCGDVIEAEAHDQGKNVDAHWAHLTVHGVLHLFGFDHQGNDAAESMETIEIQLMQKLGFPNPYLYPLHSD